MSKILTWQERTKAPMVSSMNCMLAEITELRAEVERLSAALEELKHDNHRLLSSLRKSEAALASAQKDAALYHWYRTNVIAGLSDGEKLTEAEFDETIRTGMKGETP